MTSLHKIFRLSSRSIALDTVINGKEASVLTFERFFRLGARYKRISETSKGNPPVVFGILKRASQKCFFSLKQAYPSLGKFKLYLSNFRMSPPVILIIIRIIIFCISVFHLSDSGFGSEFILFFVYQIRDGKRT